MSDEIVEILESPSDAVLSSTLTPVRGRETLFSLSPRLELIEAHHSSRLGTSISRISAVPSLSSDHPRTGEKSPNHVCVRVCVCVCVLVL